MVNVVFECPLTIKIAELRLLFRLRDFKQLFPDFYHQIKTNLHEKQYCQNFAEMAQREIKVGKLLKIANFRTALSNGCFDFSADFFSKTAKIKIFQIIIIDDFKSILHIT